MEDTRESKKKRETGTKRAGMTNWAAGEANSKGATKELPTSTDRAEPE